MPHHTILINFTMQCMLTASFKFAFLVSEIVQNGWYVIIILYYMAVIASRGLDFLIVQALS